MNPAQLSGSSTLALVGIASVALAQGKQMPDAGQEHIASNEKGVYRTYLRRRVSNWGDTWADWTVYDRPVPPEEFVHNLEHGGIVLLYRCDKPCPDLVKQLRQLTHDVPRRQNGKVKMVVAPDPKIKSPIAILAWTWIDELPRMDRDRLLSASIPRPRRPRPAKTVP
jgi:hypothetical protein